MFRCRRWFRRRHVSDMEGCKPDMNRKSSMVWFKDTLQVYSFLVSAQKLHFNFSPG